MEWRVWSIRGAGSLKWCMSNHPQMRAKTKWIELAMPSRNSMMGVISSASPLRKTCAGPQQRNTLIDWCASCRTHYAGITHHGRPFRCFRGWSAEECGAQEEQEAPGEWRCEVACPGHRHGGCADRSARISKRERCGAAFEATKARRRARAYCDGRL